MDNELDVATLSVQMGMDDAGIERRLRYVAYTPDDEKRVLSIAGVVTGHADEFTSVFFDYLESLRDWRNVKNATRILQEARQLKKEHLLAMVSGSYGRRYVEERLRLGLLYARAGLETRMFLGAFHHLMHSIGSRVMTDPGNDYLQNFECFMSFKKIAFFDISIIVDTLVFERERVIGLQAKAIHELSTPVLQVGDRLLLLPMVGVLDSHRAKHLTEGLLHAIAHHRARAVVIDITGVPIVDSGVANHLIQTAKAAELMGSRVIVTGLSADLAMVLVHLGVDLAEVEVVGSLREGLEAAERLLSDSALNL